LVGGPRTAIIAVAYMQQFTGAGGTGPYTFTMLPGSLTQEMLPPGLTMSSGGLISGTPTSTGSYFFTLKAQDTAGHTFSRGYTLLVNNANGLRVNNVNPADTWVGGARSQNLTTSGASTYTWSLVGGSLPPGVSLSPGFFGAGTTALVGAASVAGT